MRSWRLTLDNPDLGSTVPSMGVWETAAPVLSWSRGGRGQGGSGGGGGVRFKLGQWKTGRRGRKHGSYHVPGAKIEEVSKLSIFRYEKIHSVSYRTCNYQCASCLL